MAEYQAPVREMLFAIRELAGLDEVAKLPGFEEATPDLVESILNEAARFGGEVLAPLNTPGDRQGARWTADGVVTADGFAAAYRQFTEAGWNGLAGAPEHGGMGLPTLVNAATHEIWNGANMAFALCPLLTASAVTLLARHGDDALKAAYLEPLVSGRWNGSMDLTESQSGSDLGTIRSRAEPAGDGSYRLFGEKIFITWGEHDAAENTIHLVLARLPDAPAGVKGISLFLVPRFLPGANGAPGEPNDLRCSALEHKLGIHASPTCTMLFGEDQGARGWLVGEPHRGLACMFTMMNSARHKMGLQALGVSERALQQARSFARERVQGQPLDAPEGAAIIYHADVRRMLLMMKSQAEAIRALSYTTAAAMDKAAHASESEVRAAQQARVDLLTPVIKGWCPEVAVEIASLGIQIHGGMGYIEETGAAQTLRDARIMPIYEGTTGIQANDLITRKLLRDEGRAMDALLAEMQSCLDDLPASRRAPLAEAVAAVRAATEAVLASGQADGNAALASAFDYLMLVGFVVGGWQMARAGQLAQAALDSASPDSGFYRAKLGSVDFYLHQVLPRALGYARKVTNGGDALLAVPVETL